ncbi:MAG: chloride channel protein [Planctomycetota bacterium]|nr:chloride channel protein [Planctomycetota bacterium]
MLAPRMRVAFGRGMGRLGLREDSFLLLAAVLIGVVTAAAAVGFHQLIDFIRDHLYRGLGPRVSLYGKGIVVLVVLPAAGGLAVSLVSRYVFRIRQGLSVVDVIESVIRSRGQISPVSAAEKILTSAITIGSGGSAGAEGPIVQIGAGIAAGVGQLFRIAREHMPLLIGCGSAAGISAIFNAPIGGVLFTLEVILLDFSVRTFGPVVLASVMANVTTKTIFGWLDPAHPYGAIFALGQQEVLSQAELSLSHVGNFVVLGVMCGLVGVGLTRLMYFAEERFAKLKLAKFWRPALGGAMLGLLGVIYVVMFGWWLLDRPKPVDFAVYPLPAFFSDGYPIIRQLVSDSSFYRGNAKQHVMLLLAFLCLAKIVGTCLTLGSGGSGGIIAPSLFLGATAGGFLGMILRIFGLEVQPNAYALVGMGAVLAAVVHAPLASILILLELTQDHKIILPAMLATVIATGVARLIFRDSIYTLSLRLRGVRVGTLSDLSLLRRLTVEQVPLEPAMVVRPDDPFQAILDLCDRTGRNEYVVIDGKQRYVGMVVGEDIQTALLQREAVPLLLVRDLMRASVPAVPTGEDLASVLDVFATCNVDHLPVSTSRNSGNVLGVISRSALMKRYQKALEENT